MDILIKNIKMPKDCRYCPCVRFDKEYGIVRCHAVYDNCNEEDVVARDYDEWDMLDTTKSKPLIKPSWCPLVALPEHGDLIDEDEFRQVIYREIRKHKEEPITMILKGILWEMDNAPTIVEATE